MNNIILKLSAAVSLALALACGGGNKNPDPVAVTGVTVVPATLSLTAGGAAGALTANVAPSNATNKNVTWSIGSFNPAGCATLTSNGLTATVSGVAAGTATITVTTQDGTKTATCNVTVTPPVTGVTVTPTTLSLAIGGPTGSLTASVAPSNVNQAVTWTASPTGIVNIGGSGSTVTITPVTVGNTVVTATSVADTTKRATCSVTVTGGGTPVTGVTVAPTTLSLTVGGSAGSLTVSVAPSNASQAVTWTASPTGVVNIGGSGSTVTITPVVAGNTVVTATSAADATKSATCSVTVTGGGSNVTGVTLPQTFTVGINRTGHLTATIVPTSATNKNVTWSIGSLNPAGCATLTSSGLTATLSGVAAGTATVTVTTEEGQRTVSCLVTVANITEPAMYVTGNFGLYTDGVLDTLINREELTDVTVDNTGNVHAVGSYRDTVAPTWKAAYYRNGAKTLLPLTAGAIQGDANGIDVTPTGQVYIAGAETIGDSSGWVAKLWLNGVAQTLQGTGERDSAGDMFRTMASAVRVLNGSVYVAGGSDNADHSWRATIWKDGVKHMFPNIPILFGHMVIDSTGAIYARSGSVVYKISSSDFTYTTVQLDGGGTLTNIAVDGTDLYVTAWEINDAYYWKNGGARIALPRPPEGSFWAEADAVCSTGGHVYIVGYSNYLGLARPRIWKDGELIPLTDNAAIKDDFDIYREATATAIFVK